MAKDDENLSEKVAKKRMDDALRRALSAPPKPHKDIAGSRGKSPKVSKGRIIRHQGR